MNDGIVNKANINWYPGHMNKAKREIQEKLKLVDIVIIILDARIPKSSYNPDFDELFKNKPKLFLLNKARLADAKETKKWLRYYQGNNKASLDIDALSGFNLNHILTEIKKVLKDEIEKNIKKGIKKKTIRTLICGIPNVGKSTLINSISKKKAAKTGDKPGVTKALQWVKLSDELEMLDSPGILWPKFETEEIGFNLALANSIKEEILPTEEVIYYALNFFDKYYKNNFTSRFKLDPNTDLTNHEEVLEEIGRVRGCISKAGIDIERVFQLIFTEIKNNKFGNVTYDRFI